MGSVVQKLLVIALCLSAFPLAADHISKKKRPVPTGADTRYLQDLLDQCEKGNGQTCDRYGRMIAELGRPGDHERGLSYVRRACQLAYIPACQKKSPRQPARFVASVSHCGPSSGKQVLFKSINVAGVGTRLKVLRLKPRSALARNGLKKGDEISKYNDLTAGDVDRVLGAIDKGGVRLEVYRPGSAIPYYLRCP